MGKHHETSNSDCSESSHGATKMCDKISHRGLKVTFLSGVNLHDPQFFGKMDPYIKMRFGGVKVTGQVCRDAGPNPQINQVFYMPWNGEDRKIKVKVYDRERFLYDREIGVGKVDLEPIIQCPGPYQIPLTGPKDSDGGYLDCVIEYLRNEPEARYEFVEGCEDGGCSTCSSSSHGATKMCDCISHRGLKVTFFNGVNLHDPEIFGRMDPYIKMRFGGVTVRGEVCRNAGPNPQINQVFYMPWNGEDRKIKIEVYDRERFLSDREIGVGKVDLEPIIQCPGPYQIPLTGPRDSDGGYLDCKIEYLRKEPEARYEFLTDEEIGA